jgi:hypothetical protein
MNAQSNHGELQLNEDNRIEFVEIFEANGTKNELFLKSRLWFTQTFNSSESVLDLIDEQNGILIGKARGEILFDWKGTFYPLPYKYQVEIYVKDGKCKFVQKNILHIATPTQYNNYSRKETAMEIYLIDNLYKKNGKIQKNYAAWKSGLILESHSLSKNYNSFITTSSEVDQW